jgi:ribosomal protein S18 acetylase RimI-like enzyme
MAKYGIELRLLREGDEDVLSNVDPDVFDNPVDQRWTAEFFADPRHHIIVALDEDLVVGMCTSFHYVHPDKPPQMFINELGVAGSHRRRGIGRSLVEAMLAHARTLGCTEAWLGTEEDNVPARRLYEGTIAPGELFYLYELEFAKPGLPAKQEERITTE